MNPHKQKWLDENRKLYPLKEGDRLECVGSDASLWTKGRIYTANQNGFIFDDWGNACFTSEKDATNLGLFRRVGDTPQTATLTINITDANCNPVSADLLRKLADILEGKA